MRLSKFFAIIAIVAGGFGAGYALKGRQTAAPAPTTSTSVTQVEPIPAGYDPNLVLPPSDMKEVMIDAPPDIVRGHFQEIAGLTSGTKIEPPLVEGPSLPPLDLKPFPIDALPPLSNVVTPVEFRVTNEPPVIEPVRLSPTIRLPAPLEEPTPTPLLKPVIHQPVATSIYTNARDIRLNFDVARQGSSGIKAVELWGRRSAESEYECVDRMEGSASPFPTRVWSEGNYEFRVVFVGGTGVKSAIPTRNDSPDIRVCLDTTPPAVEMFLPLADPNDPGSIKLRWKADDKNIDDHPIWLEYSKDGKDWTSVISAAEWLANTGEYSWKVPAGLPTELHLRVRARDKAGNIGESRSPSKFSVDLTVPQGRINGVEEWLPVPREVMAGFSGFNFSPSLEVQRNELADYERSLNRKATVLEECAKALGLEGIIEEMCQESEKRELLPMPTEVRDITTTGVWPETMIHSEHPAPWEIERITWCEWLRLGMAGIAVATPVRCVRGIRGDVPTISDEEFISTHFNIYGCRQIEKWWANLKFDAIAKTTLQAMQKPPAEEMLPSNLEAFLKATQRLGSAGWSNQNFSLPLGLNLEYTPELPPRNPFEF